MNLSKEAIDSLKSREGVRVLVVGDGGRGSGYLLHIPINDDVKPVLQRELQLEHEITTYSSGNNLRAVLDRDLAENIADGLNRGIEPASDYPAEFRAAGQAQRIP